MSFGQVTEITFPKSWHGSCIGESVLERTSDPTHHTPLRSTQMFKKGFTLVELMIVVAIIGILAAIAIPNFVEMQYRAKRAENPANVDGIKTAQMGYDAAFDNFIVCMNTPGATLNKKTTTFNPATSGYDTLGWQPDGPTRGSYAVSTTIPGAGTPGGDFLVTGLIDVDDDDVVASYTATKSINTTFNNKNDTY